MGGRGSGSAPVPFAVAKGIDPWDRQPNETDKAFAAFVAYREMGVERSVRRVRDHMGQKAVHRSVLEKWSARWGWGVRSAAWDNHVDRRQREAILKAAEKKAHEKLSVADGMWKTAAKGLVMWSKYLDHVQKKQIEAGTFDAPPISPGDIQRLADTGLKLSQLLEGKPTDIQEQRAQLTIEERRKDIQKQLTNPRLRAAMREVAVAMKEKPKEIPAVFDSDAADSDAVH